jgi:hypothetical protein
MKIKWNVELTDSGDYHVDYILEMPTVWARLQGLVSEGLFVAIFYVHSIV